MLITVCVRFRRENSICCGSGRCSMPCSGELLEQPVVERPLVLELQRADGVRDVLQRVLDGVRVGVHRVDAPLVARAVVRGALDAVDGRVAHVDVGRGHVDLRAQHVGAVGVLAVAHLAEERQVLRRRALAEGRVLAGLAEAAAVALHLLGRLRIHVGVAVLDQALGELVHEVEVVAREVELLVARRRSRSPATSPSPMMESTYSCSSFSGLVSSKRMWQMPPYSFARPKFRQIDFACPMWR